MKVGSVLSRLDPFIHFIISSISFCATFFKTYQKFLPHFTGIARYSNLMEELMLFDEGGSVRVVWPLGVIMWTQGGVETRGPQSGDRELDHLLLYFHWCAARLCGAARVALLCNTSDTGAVTLGDQRSSAVDTVLICISWSYTHRLPPEIIARYFRYIRI